MSDQADRLITIGVLSDTHLHEPSELFRRQALACFANVDMVLHAGDLTGLAVLDVFAGKEAHGVCGNMCEIAVAAVLPRKKVLQIGGFSIGLCHGDGRGHDVEARLYDEFAPVDCIVYGHTHHPACHRYGPVLFVNPGSFMPRTRYGAPGTYAIITVGKTLTATIHEIRRVA
ncbi:MAG: YfcE family phosphodiesterase [Deltaproteobacteria bacterium RIFOXYD12_FULL_57_12]|nr:MAG: YfcE family phosphodiesterase [Deltaproteobacteria bacterium RIFOXYD12_FULL_57_12]